MMRRSTGFRAAALVLSLALAHPAWCDDSASADREFFEAKVRPVLAEHCYRCHGPERQKAKLRLDSRAALLQGGESGPAVVPGNIARSLLVKAISYTDAEFRMPPKGKLPDEAIAVLKHWVERGAHWPDDKAVTTTRGPEFNLKERSKHWSLQPLQTPAVPAVADKAWPRSPIDYFILARLEAAGLTPSGPAERRTLLRRVTYDLIGLPPTPAEIHAFLADSSSEAFARVVDRLLDSPHYGERWGRHWLDLVRYAETRGHEFDFEIPEAHLYRDYIIRALNIDVPYDRLVLEHVAGDLLPEPRRHPQHGFNESILGTGFWFLGEGKHSPVDVRSDQADRRDNQIDVFSKTFLGMTVACARCHDHKFDAISTADYYGLAGFLESSRFQRAFFEDPQPYLDKAEKLRALQQRSRGIAVPIMADALRPQLDRLAAEFPAGPDAAGNWGRSVLPERTSANKSTAAPERSVPAERTYPDFAVRRAALVKALKEQEARASSDATTFADFSAHDFREWITTGFAVERSAGDTLRFDDKDPEAARGLVPANQAHSGLLSPRLEGVLQSPTFTISTKRIHYLVGGRNAKINLIIDGFQLIRSPIYGGLTSVINHGEALRWVSMDVSMWQGHRAYIEVLDDGNGFAVLDRVAFSDGVPPPLPPNRLLLRLLADERAASAEELTKNYRTLFAEIVDQLAAGKLALQADAAERIEILNWMLESAAAVAKSAELSKLQAERRAMEASLPTPRRALAMLDGTPVDEHVFIRGNHKKLGDVVPRRFLEVFGGQQSQAAKAGSGRLELARRMVDPGLTPIVPRVMVNRVWKQHFGEGIVRSTDDFGVLGQTPTHPELLDFLAGEFVKNGWSLKKLHRQILLSSTYQMSSVALAASPGKAHPDEVDPTNKLLHRMPIRRLEAEIIRDGLLAVSGRLDRTLYGPSVMPHLTPFMAGRGRPGQSGPLDGNGRRSIYLGVRRNFLTPMFQAFDYPTPFSTIGRRSVSNVPAQALTMMNNPLVTQQAELWSQRVLAKPGLSRAERVTEMYETAFARPPSPMELQDALAFVTEQSAIVGREDVAWSDLGHVLFNLKEFIFVQ